MPEPPSARDSRPEETGEPSLWRNPAIYLALAGIATIVIVFLKVISPHETALPGPAVPQKVAREAAQPKAGSPPQSVDWGAVQKELGAAKASKPRAVVDQALEEPEELQKPGAAVKNPAAPAERGGSDRGDLSAKQIASKAMPSVVTLFMHDANQQPLRIGSGFFVKESTIATNLHVVENASGGYAKLVGQDKKAKIEGICAQDADNDLVLLKVSDLGGSPLEVAAGRAAEVGDKVYVIGSPLGLEGSLSEGIVSGVRSLEGVTLYQITAPISPGNSGGPVLGANGAVLGVAVATLREGQNLNFAIPAKYVAHCLAKAGASAPLSDSRAAPTGAAGKAMGTQATDAITVTHFEFISNYAVAFSLLNTGTRSISDVSFLVMFHDSKGEPIHFQVGVSRDCIPPGLARRIQVQINFETANYVIREHGKGVVRVVSFQYAD